MNVNRNFEQNIGLRPLFLMILLILLGLVFWPSEKDQLDKQMAELCKKDGGVKIYETVKLPPEMFDELGQPHFSRDTDFKRFSNGTTRKLGEAYTYIIVNTTLKAGDPLKGEVFLGRSHYKIQRNSDKKILAEAIQYLRAGGDLLTFGHHSSKACPAEQKGLIEQVFVKI